MMSDRKWIYYFSDPSNFADVDESRKVLGGKGDSLKSMTLAGLAVPPGFTIETGCCLEYLRNESRWPEGLESELRENITRLEKETGREFGVGTRPLLVSVRSGAPVSMPGMMDTILNCGVHAGLYEATGSNDAFWKVYAQFVLSFAQSVHSLTEVDFVDKGSPQLEDVKSKADVDKYISVYNILSGLEFPTDPWMALVESINAVFSSWNSARAVSYRTRNGLTENTGTAVSIQMMFPSVVSGIVFTRSPSDPESDSMIVESSFGLGEAVVSGDADPDRFTLNRTSLETTESHIGKKNIEFFALGSSEISSGSESSLSDEQLHELGELALKVEEYFGYPLDIEFGFDGQKLALLQSRRIRGLEVLSEATTYREEECLRLKNIAGENRKVWISHNLSETLKYPTPLTWDIVRYFMSGAGGMGEMYRQLGYSVSESESEDFLDLICGSIYADPDRIVSMLWRGLPVSCDLGALGTDVAQLGNPPVLLDPGKADTFLLLRLPSLIFGAIASGLKVKKLKQTAKDTFDNDVLPGFLDYAKKERKKDLQAMTDGELRDLLSSRRRYVLRDFAAATLVPGFLGALNMRALDSLLQRLLGESDGQAVTQTLIGGMNSISSQQSVLLGRVAAGEADINEFLEKFGHRTSDEMELSVPRWREDRSVLDIMLKNNSIQDASASSSRSQEEVFSEAEKELPRRLEQVGASSFLEEVMSLVKETRRLLPYRENGKHYLMMGYELIRSVVLELGKRLEVGEDVFYLHWTELIAGDSADADLKDAIEKRKVRHKALKTLYLPPLIDSEDLDAIGRSPIIDESHRMKATPVSPGVAKAQAKILFEPKDVGSQENFILVCPSTDPGWTPLLTRASGLIVERGGILSHGALIARDLGVPAVVLPHATRIINDNSMVIIDGTSGGVEIVEESDKQ